MCGSLAGSNKWACIPPIGSNPYGIDGYKSISFEIFEELGEVPDFVSVPQLILMGYMEFGGMTDLRELRLTENSQMIAAEVFGSLKTTLQDKSTKPVSVDSKWSVSFPLQVLRNISGTAALKESMD